jgi:LmbE family N-acetylglucosaminyl deacetylase
MRRLRAGEQVEAARLGRYSFSVQLAYSSDAVQKPDCPDLIEDLIALVSATQPQFLYTHNPADLHDTHVGVSLKVIEAVRHLPEDKLPEALYGCEVWRGLDWLPEEDKIALNVGGDEDLATSLIEIFKSQNESGKSYTAATMGRRRANATYYQPYAVDKYDGLCFAMDLTPLVRDPELDVVEYVLEHIDRFRRDVEMKIKRCRGA